MPGMGLRIIWIQLDRAFEFALGAGPVTIVIVFNVSQRHMRFGESSIDLYGFQRRGLRLWQRLVWRCHSAGIWRAQQIISVCQSTVSQRERGVLFYRLLKIFERLLQPFFGSFVVVKSSFHVKLISLVAFGVMFGKPALLTRDLEFQGVDDFAGNLSLRGQQLRRFAIVLFAPQQLVVAHVNQFSADGQIVAALDDPAGKHRANAQVFAYLYRIDLLAFVTKDQTGGTDFQVRQL